MRVLITGIHGFVGSHLAAFSLEQGHDVIGIARSPSSYGDARVSRISDHRKLHIRYIDLTTDISGITERVDLVFHLAARTFVNHSIMDPATFVRNNYLASFNLLEDARRNCVPRFIQMSTDEVYGPIMNGRHTENATLAPSNPYAATKAASDLLICAYHRTYGFPGIVARASNIYGSWQHPQKVIPTFVRSALADTPLPIFGDGAHQRAWIAVEDVCVAMWIIARRGEVGTVYHVAGEEETTNLELGRMILELLERPTDLVTFIPDRNARPGHDRRYALANERLHNLGWQTALKLRGNLPRVIEWFREHTWWLTS